MNDVLVEIVSVATIKKYEFWLPKKGLIRDVILKLAEETVGCNFFGATETSEIPVAPE